MDSTRVHVSYHGKDSFVLPQESVSSYEILLFLDLSFGVNALRIDFPTL